MGIIMENSNDLNPEAIGRGRLRLKPIAGSVDRSTLVVDIDLHHQSQSLTLGDLRRSAERLTSEQSFEQAFRLWSIVSTAAGRVDAQSLATYAASQADRAQHSAQFMAAADRRTAEQVGDRSSTKYDYDELSNDVAAGMSRTMVARKWGCAPSTVQRAVDYVTERDELLEQSPEILDQLMAGVDLGVVASRYDVSPKVLRWMVNSNFNRRAE